MKIISYSNPAPNQHPLNPSPSPDWITSKFSTNSETNSIFTGPHYWKLTEDGVAEGYPKMISQSWIGLPGNIDTAFTYKNGKTYFFKGSKYWKYDGKKLDGEYPKDINEGFTGIPDNLQAAMVWSGNGKIYFFKGKPLLPPPSHDSSFHSSNRSIFAQVANSGNSTHLKSLRWRAPIRNRSPTGKVYQTI